MQHGLILSHLAVAEPIPDAFKPVGRPAEEPAVEEERYFLFVAHAGQVDGSRRPHLPCRGSRLTDTLIDDRFGFVALQGEEGCPGTRARASEFDPVISPAAIDHEAQHGCAALQELHGVPFPLLEAIEGDVEADRPLGAFTDCLPFKLIIAEPTQTGVIRDHILRVRQTFGRPRHLVNGIDKDSLDGMRCRSRYKRVAGNEFAVHFIAVEDFACGHFAREPQRHRGAARHPGAADRLHTLAQRERGHGAVHRRDGMLRLGGIEGIADDALAVYLVVVEFVAGGSAVCRHIDDVAEGVAVLSRRHADEIQFDRERIEEALRLFLARHEADVFDGWDAAAVRSPAVAEIETVTLVKCRVRHLSRREVAGAVETDERGEHIALPHEVQRDGLARRSGVEDIDDLPRKVAVRHLIPSAARAVARGTEIELVTDVIAHLITDNLIVAEENARIPGIPDAVGERDAVGRSDIIGDDPVGGAAELAVSAPAADGLRRLRVGSRLPRHFLRRSRIDRRDAPRLPLQHIAVLEDLFGAVHKIIVKDLSVRAGLVLQFDDAPGDEHALIARSARKGDVDDLFIDCRNGVLGRRRREGIAFDANAVHREIDERLALWGLFRRQRHRLAHAVFRLFEHDVLIGVDFRDLRRQKGVDLIGVRDEPAADCRREGESRRRIDVARAVAEGVGIVELGLCLQKQLALGKEIEIVAVADAEEGHGAVLSRICDDGIDRACVKRLGDEVRPLA